MCFKLCKTYGGALIKKSFEETCVLQTSSSKCQLCDSNYISKCIFTRRHRKLVPYGLDRARLFLLKDNCPFFFYTLSSLNFSGLPINFMNDWSLQCNYILNYTEHLHPSSITRWKTSDEKKGPTSSILFLRQVLNT